MHCVLKLGMHSHYRAYHLSKIITQKKNISLPYLTSTSSKSQATLQGRSNKSLKLSIARSTVISLQTYIVVMRFSVVCG